MAKHTWLITIKRTKTLNIKSKIHGIKSLKGHLDPRLESKVFQIFASQILKSSSIRIVAALYFQSDNLLNIYSGFKIEYATRQNENKTDSSDMRESW